MDAKQFLVSVVTVIFKVVVAAIILMYVYRYAVTAYDYGFRIFGEPAMDAEPGRDVEIIVKDEYTVADIALLLEEKGLIRDAKLFELQEKLSGLKEGIAPGTYKLNTAMTIEDMLPIMAAGAATAETEES